VEDRAKRSNLVIETIAADAASHASIVRLHDSLTVVRAAV